MQHPTIHFTHGFTLWWAWKWRAAPIYLLLLVLIELISTSSEGFWHSFGLLAVIAVALMSDMAMLGHVQRRDAEQQRQRYGIAPAADQNTVNLWLGWLWRRVLTGVPLLILQLGLTAHYIPSYGSYALLWVNGIALLLHSLLSICMLTLARRQQQQNHAIHSIFVNLY